MPKKLSVILCVKNEEEIIKTCLESIKWVDEIIVIDDFSIDKTLEIAQKYTKKIFQNKWRGFSDQKNFGFKKVSGDWILFLDADERITPELRKEISDLLKKRDVPFSAFNLKRLNNFLGKDMYYGGWFPDYQKRLVKKEKFKKWEGRLHEQLLAFGQTGELKSFLYHQAHRRLSLMVEKSLLYTKFEVEEMLKSNHPKMVWWRFFRPMFTEFIYRLITKSGWRDGMIGWIEAIYQSFNKFLIYARLWEIQINQKGIVTKIKTKK